MNPTTPKGQFLKVKRGRKRKGKEASQLCRIFTARLPSLMAISKGNLGHDRGENATPKSVRRSLVSTSESENVMQNPTNDRRFSDELTTVDPVLH